MICIYFQCAKIPVALGVILELKVYSNNNNDIIDSLGNVTRESPKYS